MKLCSGYIVLDLSTATGGVSYTRTQRKRRKAGKGVKENVRTVKRVDHKQLVRDSDALVQAARYVLRCYAANTSLGWFAHADHLPTIEAEFEALEREARALNHRAAQEKSDRRVKIGYAALPADPTNPRVAYELERTVAELFAEIRHTLRSGDITGLNKLFLRAKNIEYLTRGDQDAILFAIAEAKEARRTLRRADHVKHAAQLLDLRHIDACLSLFDIDELLA